jgi:membrane protease YdiL (CAAX protease family)
MKEPKFMNVWTFFGAVYLVSALLWAPVMISGMGIEPILNKLLALICTFVPSGMGVVFICLTRDREGRRDFWRRVFRWPRAHTRTSLLSIALMVFIAAFSYTLPGLLRGEPLGLGYAVRILRDWQLALQFLLVEFFLGAVSEELGWRGYALAELQRRWSPLASGLILGVVWALWHTPAFLIPGLSQYEMGGVFSWPYIAFIINVVCASVIHTWAYNRTGRSILVAVLMHFAFNATAIFMGGIFDQYSVPEGYWVAFPVVSLLTAAGLTLTSLREMVQPPVRGAGELQQWGSLLPGTERYSR